MNFDRSERIDAQPAVANLSVALARSPGPIADQSDRIDRIDRFKFFEPLLWIASLLMALIAWVVVAARFGSDQSLAVDLTRHALLHVWVPSSVTLAIAAVFVLRCFGSARRRWLMCSLLLLPPCIYSGWVTQPWQLLPLVENRLDASGQRVRVLAWNVLFSNEQHDRVAAIIEETDADVVAIIECTGWLLQNTESLQKRYPYSSLAAGGPTHGVVVLSRIPNTQLQLLEFEGRIATELRWKSPADKRLHRMLLIHASSPRVVPDGHADRDRQLAAVGKWAAAESDVATLVVGDLNTTPYSPVFSRLLREGGLFDSRAYRGHFATWPAPLGNFGIPIDHALINSHVKIAYRGVAGGDAGSDHRGIVFEIE